VADPQTFTSEPPEGDSSWIMAVIIGTVAALVLSGGGLWWISSSYDSRLMRVKDELTTQIAAKIAPDLSKPLEDLSVRVVDLQKVAEDLDQKHVDSWKAIKDDKYEIYLLWKNVGRMRKKLAALEVVAAQSSAEMTIPGVPYDQIAPVPSEPPVENPAPSEQFVPAQ